MWRNLKDEKKIINIIRLFVFTGLITISEVFRFVIKRLFFRMIIGRLRRNCWSFVKNNSTYNVYHWHFCFCRITNFNRQRVKETGLLFFVLFFVRRWNTFSRTAYLFFLRLLIEHKTGWERKYWKGFMVSDDVSSYIMK